MLSDPTTELARHVVLRAINDLFAPHKGPSAEFDGLPTEKEKVETIRFLTDEEGAFARSREDWCIMADQEPDAVRKQVIAFLMGDDELRQHVFKPRGTRGREAMDRAIIESRAIYARLVTERETSHAAWRRAAELRREEADARRLDREKTARIIDKACRRHGDAEGIFAT